MTTKIFRGDAPAVAQVSRITPATVEIGDTFTVTINGKSITVTATAATVANVIALMVAAIDATDIAEFLEITASDDTTSLLLTANTAGVPFVVTSSASNGGYGGVSVSTTTQGSAAASSVQAFTVPAAATGTWTIEFGGQVTPAQAVGASAATILAAIEALSTVGVGQIASVTKTTAAGSSGNQVYTVTFGGTLASMALSLLVIKLQNAKPIVWVETAGSPIGPVTNEVVYIRMPDSDVSAYTYNFTFGGETSPSRYYTSGATILINLVHAGDWPATNLVLLTYLGANLYKLEFTADLGGSNVGAVTTSATWSAAQGSFYLTVTESTVGSAAVNEVQVVTLTGGATGGTFTLTYSGQTTSAIAYNASAATVDAALEALSNIGAGDVSVAGSAGGPWTVTFATALAATNVAEMTASGASLTGGSTQGFVTSAVTASAGPNHWDTASNWSPVNVPITGDDVRFENSDTDCLYGLDQTGVTLASLRMAMTYTGQLGLKLQNDGGYREYRTTELTCGITSVMIGYGDGGGPRKVALNTLAVQTAIEIRGTGGSSESYIPTVTWRGSHASNVVTVLDGEFGSAQYSDQSATIYDFLQRGGSVSLKNTAVTNQAIYTRQRLSAYNCTLSGAVWDA